jgi:hypothetical protein
VHVRDNCLELRSFENAENENEFIFGLRNASSGVNDEDVLFFGGVDGKETPPNRKISSLN